jgi:hypothetical protein
MGRAAVVALVQTVLAIAPCVFVNGAMKRHGVGVEVRALVCGVGAGLLCWAIGAILTRRTGVGTNPRRALVIGLIVMACVVAANLVDRL